MARTRSSRVPAWIRPWVMLLVLAYGAWAAAGLHAEHERFRRRTFQQPQGAVRLWVNATVPLFAWLSIAVLFLEALLPLGQRRWRNPGLVPGSVVLVIMARNVVESAALSLRYRGGAPFRIWDLVALALPAPHKLGWMTHSVGVPVAAAWIAMFAFGWWRPARTWTELGGRLLGVYWIVAGVIDPWHSSLI